VVAGIPLLTLATLTIQHALNVTQLLSDLTRKAAGMERLTAEQLETFQLVVDTHGERAITVLVSDLKALLSSHADAQRALDAEREKVAGYDRWLSGGVYFTNAEYNEHIKKHNAELATLQAQLESANVLMYKKNCALGRADTTITDLQAQLRQVEGERDAARHRVDELEAREIDVEILQGDLTALRQLVSALPVVDVQEVSVRLSPDESGWLVSKRPAFPAGLYWAKFRTQAEADSFRALLAYRAALAAQDAGKAVSSG